VLLRSNSLFNRDSQLGKTKSPSIDLNNLIYKIARSPRSFWLSQLSTNRRVRISFATSHWDRGKRIKRSFYVGQTMIIPPFVPAFSQTLTGTRFWIYVSNFNYLSVKYTPYMTSRYIIRSSLMSIINIELTKNGRMAWEYPLGAQNWQPICILTWLWTIHWEPPRLSLCLQHSTQNIFYKMCYLSNRTQMCPNPRLCDPWKPWWCERRNGCLNLLWLPVCFLAFLITYLKFLWIPSCWQLFIDSRDQVENTAQPCFWSWF